MIGTDWLAAAHFDVDAKLPAGATRAQIPEMLKSMLEERFQIKVREDSKDLSVYGLVSSPGANRLKDMSNSAEVPDANAASQGKSYGGPGGMGSDYGNGSSYDLRDGKFEAKKFSMFAPREPALELGGPPGSRYDGTERLIRYFFSRAG